MLFVQYLFLAIEQGGNDITLPYCDIIQHILIPARSVARKTLFATMPPGCVTRVATLHNVLFVQYLFLATEQGGNDITLPYCDIIQHILIPARSVARKTLL